MLRLSRFSWVYDRTFSYNDLPRRTLGKTGYAASVLGLGGQGSLERQRDKDVQIRIIRKAYELGVNYMDTAPAYGPSEEYYGEAIPDFRREVFLASKTHDRTRDGSLKLIEKSLKRLKTSYLDLWQIHNISRMEEVEEACGEDGALQALLEMQEQGVVKHLGFTGHEDPEVMLEMIRRHPFDAVLCPVNACDRNMDPSFLDTLVPVANTNGMGVIGMKVFAQGYIFHSEGIRTAQEALFYALSAPIDTVIVGCDSAEQLEENVAVAKSFANLSEEQMRELEERTSGYKKRAQFFRKQFGGYDSQDKLGKKHTPQELED